MIPSDMATGDPATIEEERRLLYVAMTRARDALEVYFPLRYHRRPRGRGDAHVYSQLTRFIPDGLRQLFDERSVSPNDGADAAEPADLVPATRGGLDELFDRLWGPET